MQSFIKWFTFQTELFCYSTVLFMQLHISVHQQYIMMLIYTHQAVALH